MALQAAELMGYDSGPRDQIVTAREAILYALSAGYGTEDLPHVAGACPRVVPTMANVIAHPGAWTRAAGANWTGVVHAEQRLVLHRPIPLDTRLSARTRAVAITDRGPGRGMFATFERVIHDDQGAAIATVTQTDACRLDGGCGSAGVPPAPLAPLPDTAPEQRLALAIGPRAALLYQLNGDTNPLHSCPETARAAGFERPILHGLCTFAQAARLLSQACAGQELVAIEARFSAVVYPGEQLALDLWRQGALLRFRLSAPGRAGVIVLDRDTAQCAPARR